MKRKIALGLCSLLVQLANAQLYISTGSSFSMNGNALLTLQNADLVNHGSFVPGLGTVVFNGDQSSAIRGSQYTAFNILEMNKAGNDTVYLFRNVFIADAVNFFSGHIDLNGKVLDLGIAGRLNGERESSRVVGLGGGYVVISAALNNPVYANPGNLGAMISSGSNLGNVQIRRGHRSQNNSYGLGYSLQRYYDIIPANNTNLNATFRFNYFNSELNGIPENMLSFWSSSDSLHWNNQGYTSGHVDLNYLEKQGIGSFPLRWTLAEASNPLPVNFRYYTVECMPGAVLLHWQTSQEQNSDYFRLERSLNSIDWTALGSTAAAGNSNTVKNYSFTDNNPVANGYYRIVQVDKDGKRMFSNILRSSCSNDEYCRTWPNPFTDQIHVALYQSHASLVALVLHDDAGRLIKKESLSLPAGSSQLTIPASHLPKGVYWLSVYRDNSKKKETFKLVRQ